MPLAAHLQISRESITPTRIRDIRPVVVEWLTDSMRKHGWMVGLPLVVIQTSDGYKLVDGHHRYEAAKRLGIVNVPIEIVDLSLPEYRHFEHDPEMLAFCRNQINTKCAKIDDFDKAEFIVKHRGERTQKELGDVLGYSRSRIESLERFYYRFQSVWGWLKDHSEDRNIISGDELNDNLLSLNNDVKILIPISQAKASEMRLDSLDTGGLKEYVLAIEDGLIQFEDTEQFVKVYQTIPEKFRGRLLRMFYAQDEKRSDPVIRKSNQIESILTNIAQLAASLNEEEILYELTADGLNTVETPYHPRTEFSEGIKVIEAEIDVIGNTNVYSNQVLHLYESVNTTVQNRSKAKMQADRARRECEIAESINKKILCGDSAEILKSVPDNSIHLVITSPPYNIGMNYDIYLDDVSQESYRKSLIGTMTEIFRVLEPGGKVVVNLPKRTHRNESMKTRFQFVLDMSEIGFLLRDEIIWDKNNTSRRTAWGSYCSPRNPYTVSMYEILYVFSKGKMELEGIESNIDITPEEFIAYTNDIWSITGETRDVGHPAAFPEELVYRLIKLYSFQGNVVLDPYGGSGTTPTVAAKCGRDFLYIELSGGYREVAFNRVKDVIMKGVEFSSLQFRDTVLKEVDLK